MRAGGDDAHGFEVGSFQTGKISQRTEVSVIKAHPGAEGH